jgi:hypothetical protein
MLIILLPFIELAIMSSAIDINKKHTAVSGAIRPATDVATALIASLKNTWSIPKSNLKRYSIRVSNPIKPVSNEKLRLINEIIFALALFSNSAENISVSPISTNPIAVLAFIETQIGRILFRIEILSSHPKSTVQPTRTDNIPIYRPAIYFL